MASGAHEGNNEMNDYHFTQLLKKAARIAAENKDVQARITEAFEARYGVNHSDANNDKLIDTLDYGMGWYEGHFTAEKVDKEMAESGFPKLEGDASLTAESAGM